jgi:hypothetical protein
MEMVPVKTGFGAVNQPEMIMEFRGVEQPMAMVSGVPRQSALGYMPRVV